MDTVPPGCGVGSRVVSTFLSVVWLLRLLVTIVGAVMFTWWALGEDSWFEAPLPGRSTVFLIALGLGVGFLVCTGLLWLGSSGLPEEERAQVRSWDPFS